jgi:superfamily II DNA or RNA helicase
MEILRILSKANSWHEINQKLEELTKSGQAKLAGNIFELIVKNYLLTEPKYHTILKNVWLLNEVKETIKRKLNLPDQDEGIDLIAETKEGHFWAIQAKYRSDPNETLTLGGKGSLATFSNLAFRYCKNITHGLVVTTVNRPPKKIKLIKQIGFETLESFLSLDDNNSEGWNLLVARSIGKIIKPHKLEPRPHQIEAIKKTVEYFKSRDRGKVIMPCGTGKSLAAFWIANEMKAKSIIIAVPSLALLQQTLKVWTKEFLINDIAPNWLCVCSDDTVKEDQDSFVSYTYDLGIEVTTDKNEIKKFLKAKTNNIKVVFTTYQSGKVTAAGSKGFTFDLGIMDEAHKTVGHGDKPMAHLIHQRNIKIKHRLFMTATERLFRGDKEEYLSMDDPRDYGEIIYELTFKDAINSNPPIITDYKIITFGVSEGEIEELYNDNKFIQVGKELKDIKAREFATALALRKAIKKLKITNAISFHSSIRRAQNFKEQQELITKIYPEYEKLKTFHVSGDMPTSERSSQMRLFAESKGLMTNARCLTEGVDLPAIDCVCFTDPKRSKVDIVQAAGRALRLSPGKKFGYILIPIFIPADQDPETASKDNAFEEVVATVGALSTQDTRIAEYLRAITEGKVPRGGSPVDGKITVNVLTKINPERFNKAIQLKVWDKIARINKRTYEEAKKYAQSLKLRSAAEWYIHTKTKIFPKDIPVYPGQGYKNKFEGMYIFLGLKNYKYAHRNFRSYDEAKKYAKSLNLKTSKEWFNHTKSKNFPMDIPAYPYAVYKEKFISMGDFLGTNFIGHQNRKYRSYKEAKKYAQSLQLNSLKEWYKFTKTNKFPKDIPAIPGQTYKKDYEGSGIFLGTGRIANQLKKFVSFKKAKEFVKKNNIKSISDWIKITKSKNFPNNIPKSLPGPYKNLWKSYGDFFSTGEIATYLRKYRSYKNAKKYVQSLKLNNIKQWKIYTKNKKFPINLPKYPPRTYKKNWESWGIFLGTGRIANQLKNKK